jgi:predicted O-linked N-acetylglucosamine transferase (SPINDLY family)
MDPATLYREHQEWNRLFARPDAKRKELDYDRSDCRRIRVGYVSPDLREHTVTKFIGAALKHHYRGQFEVFCYSGVTEADRITERLRGQVEHWRDIVGLLDEQVERLIRDDRIDLLVDLRGHASGNRMTLFAGGCAPVQLNMVGYFDTTGLAAMDYRITDGFQDPHGMSEQFHSENLLRLPHTCWCYMPEEDLPPIAQPPSQTSGHITFGSLNKIIKVSKPCAGVWNKVLEAVPNSRLMLSVVSDEAAEAITQRLVQYGLPADRLYLLSKTEGHREYMERFNQIDIALDTFPFNGITTTCECLWMGVPEVSLAGSTTVSRVGRSILHAVDLGELSATTPQQFVNAAVKLASDSSALEALRLGMRDRMLVSPLMDHIGFAAKLESVYRQIWQQWLSGAGSSERLGHRDKAMS